MRLPEYFKLVLLTVLLYGMQPTPLHAQFQGSTEDGHAAQSFLGLLGGTSTQILYGGGSGHGFSQSRRSGFLQGTNHGDKFKGGMEDGYAAAGFTGSLGGTATAVLFGGGPGDGFHQVRTGGKLEAVPLPISLISFTAFPQNDFVVIKWVTESELNNDFFTIERSQEAISFKPLLQVPGAGTTTVLQTYREIDSVPLPGTSYYRLKSTDFDGTFSHSQIVAVNRDTPVDWNLRIFPNPSSGQALTLELTGIEDKTDLQIAITDIQGRAIYQRYIDTAADAIQHNIALENQLAKGSYLVRIWTNDQQLHQLIVVH